MNGRIQGDPGGSAYYVLPVWVDINHDGFLDLFMAKEPERLIIRRASGILSS